MNKNQNTTKTYFTPTGNPFVDGGIYAIEAYYKEDFSSLTPAKLETKIDELIDLYLTDGWKKSLYSVFTGNSKYSNPSIKDKKVTSVKYLKELLDEFSVVGTVGTCVACGRRDALPIRN